MVNMENLVDSLQNEQAGWLSLRDASGKLGVSPATLRLWADEGRVESYRTPGGHRRFRLRGDGTPFRDTTTRRGDARWRLLEHSALGRLRGTENFAHPAAPSQARNELRELERALVRLCTQTVQQGGGDFETRAITLGEAYAKWNWRVGANAGEALRHLGMLRRAFLASVVEFSFGIGEPDADELNLWLERANETIDRVCISMLEYRNEDIKPNARKR